MFQNAPIFFKDLGLSTTLRGAAYSAVSRGDILRQRANAKVYRGEPLEEVVQNTRADTGPVARLHLLGPVRLIDRDGKDCTPRGGVRRALLAILALSQHGTKSRLKLQDLIWGDRDPQKGASSLRNALSVLKTDLAKVDDALLVTDGQASKLDISRLWVDVFEYAKPENMHLLRQTFGTQLPDLIEGINVRSTGDDSFEDWLRSERQHWLEQLEPLLVAATARPMPASAPKIPASAPKMDIHTPVASVAPQGIGLLSTIARASDPHAALFGDAVLDAVASSLRDQNLTEIYDFRDGSPMPMAGGVAPSVMLQVKLFQDSERLNMTLLAYGAKQQKLLWSWPVAARYEDGLNFDNRVVSSFINQSVDRVSKSLQQLNAKSETPHVATPYQSLNTMFQLGEDALGNAKVLLSDAHAASGEAVHLSLLAYLNTFRVGEHWQTYDQSVRQQTHELVQNVLVDDPFNSVALTMAGHASGYVLHDFALSGDLLRRALQLNPTLAIGWDHMALHHMYSGQYDKAAEAAKTAIHLGEFSPLRFTFETTLCMIATLKGDYATAAQFGERALARRPSYGAALRYMSVSLAHLGREAEAHGLVERIKMMAPDFSGEWVLRNRLAVTDDRAKTLLLSGLEKAGV